MQVLYRITFGLERNRADLVRYHPTVVVFENTIMLLTYTLLLIYTVYKVVLQLLVFVQDCSQILMSFQFFSGIKCTLII